MSTFISNINEYVSIVYINSDLLKNFSNILNRIKYIAKSCGFQPEFYTNTTFLFYFYLKDFYMIKDKKRAFDIINQNAKQIFGFVRVQGYRDHLEFFDLCVLESYRRKGVAKTILKDLIQKELKYYDFFWLGIDINNPNRDILLNMYLSLGFKFESVRTNTVSGKNIPFTILSMFLEKNYKGFNSLKDTKLEIFNSLKTIRCSLKLYLDYKDARYIYKTYSENSDVEYAGIMDFRSYLDGYILKENQITKGTEFNVKIPNSYISWHTHPNICYKLLGCYIGWPSGIDMGLFFINYHLQGSILNFVFCVEGIYIVTLTEEMMRFVHVISHEQNWMSSITELVEYKFTFLEEFRLVEKDIERLKCLRETRELDKCFFYQNLKQKEYISNFLNLANNLSLKQYIVTGQEYELLKYNGYYIDMLNNEVKNSIIYYENFSNNPVNFPLFKVEYISTYNQDILGNLHRIDLNFLKAPINPFCP